MGKKTNNARLWLMIWGLGLAGQICWNLENSWFNTFVYAKIGKDPSVITGMLICSAAATTFSTFFFGTWSDRSGKRMRFVGWGYILWGLFTIAFGLTEFINKDLYLLAAISVVLADTIMSFFGSMGNDAGFNAWINDRLDGTNRGPIGAALATQPVIGTILGTVVGGLLVGSDDNYLRLFTVMGVLVIACGIYALATRRPEDETTPSVRGSFWNQFFSVFAFREFFSHHELLLVNTTVAVFFIGFNAYFAYIGNYLIYYLGYTADQMGIIEAVPLVLSMLTAIPVSGLINKGHYVPVAVGGAITNAIGLLILRPLTPAQVDTSSLFSLQLWLGIFVLGMGYIAFLQTTKVWAKQLYPENSKGQFEGIWIIFFVLIPMIGGSLLGEHVVRLSGETFMDAASGQMSYVPNGNIFLFGMIPVLLSVIPAVLAGRMRKK